MNITFHRENRRINLTEAPGILQRQGDEQWKEAR
jgi:hypothetical protein